MSAQLEALRSYVARHPAPPAATPPRGAVVVASGKGGVGTSTVASLLAVAAAGAGGRVLLVDGDPGMGSLHLLFGVDAGPGLGALRDGASHPGDLVLPLAGGLHLLPAGVVPFGGSAAERQALLRRLSSLHPEFDLVLLDAGARMEAVLGAAAAGAARVLLVSTVERIALTATYAMAKVLSERQPALPVELLTNRVDAETGEAAAQQIQAAAAHFLRCSLGFAGTVPEDDCLSAAVDAGMDLQDAAVGSPAAARLQPVASRMLRSLTQAPSLPERLHLPRRF